MEKVAIRIGAYIHLDGVLPSTVRKYLTQRLTFLNPKWIENDKYGYWQGDTPQHLSFIEGENKGLLIPRGFTSQLTKILSYNQVPYILHDRTRQLEPVPFEFKGMLHSFQDQAVKEVLARRFGVLNSPTGSGKTVIALYLIAERKQPALVIVHTKELLYQWRDRAIEFLGLQKEEIGLLGDGNKAVGDRLTIGIINSVYKEAEGIRGRIGYLIVDECHRTPARTFTEAVSAFDSRYMLGLSATPYRRDGLTRLIYFFIGDQVYSIETKALQDLKRIMKPRLVVRKTAFDYDYRDDYQEMISTLTQDRDRNELIAADVIKATQGNGNKGILLVVSDRKEHCRALYDLVKGKKSAKLLIGDVSSGKRKQIVEDLNRGTIKVLIATSQLIGEGFDLKSLSHIFLATPVKFTGRVKQNTGRILRTAEGKHEAVIYDYVDKPGVLQASFKTRTYAYKELGIEHNY